MKRTILAVIALGLLAGCSSINVNSDYSVDADFSQFETFQYRGSSNTVEAAAPLAHQRIVDAIRTGMRSSGLTETDGEPDVYVSYYGSTDDEIRFTTTYTGVGQWRRPGWSSGWGVATSSTQQTTVTHGTLVIDIWDAESNSLVWRGIATSPLSRNPDRNAAKISSAVERVFLEFPPS